MGTQSAERIKSFFAAEDRTCPPVRESEVYRDIIPFRRANACGLFDPWSEEFHIRQAELPEVKPIADVPEHQPETPAQPDAAAKALFLSFLNAARQHFSEYKQTASIEDLHAIILLGRERTVPATARLIGVDGVLNQIVDMTTSLFGAPATVSVGEVHDPSLLVTVNVGADADLRKSLDRENGWYKELVAISPRASGRMFLVVNF
jgi:hypothetical protein